MTLLRLVQFGSLLLTLLALAPTLAHLLELPTKLGLAGRDYLTVQQIYRGWALAEFVVAGGAIWSTVMLAAFVHANGAAFAFAVVAIVFMSATQAVFWAFTFPVNRTTHDWTELPANWGTLRSQWEYSHATSAALGLTGFVALVVSVVLG